MKGLYSEKLTKAFEKMDVLGLAHHPSRTDNFKTEQDKKNKELDEKFRRRIEDAKKGAHRLRDVFAAPMKMVADFVPPSYPKSKEETEFINEKLKDSFLLGHVDSWQRKAFVDAMEPIQVKKDTTIIWQGDTGDYFYLIHNGTVTFVVDGKTVGSAGSGESFGDLALLYDCPRAATCIAETDCKLFRVDQRTCKRLLAGFTLKGDAETKRLLRKVSFMKDLDEKNLTKIAMSLSVVTFEKDEVLVNRGDEAKMFCIVKEGALKATDIDIGDSHYDDIMFGPGDFFGEGAIVENKPTLAKVVATEKTTCLTLSRECFTKLFGNLGALKLRSQDAKKLMAIPFPNNRKFKKDQIDALTGFIVEVKFKKGHIFFVEGIRTTPALFFVRSGKVSVSSSKLGLGFEWLGFALGIEETKPISEGGYFGNDLIDPNEDDLALPKYTATAETDCIVGVLTWDSFKFAFGPETPTGESAIPFEDLVKHKILGAGTFGKVWLVSQKGTKDAYALKVQNKRQLIEFGQAEGVTREKNIMARLDHPFIIKLVSSYKDENCVYMLMKLYQGGELQSVIHTDKRNGLPEYAAQFYAAGVLEGLGYMHRLHVLYRDLKPENVLLDSDGYTVIVDLGFAKVVPDKTYTFCGTPLYIAPEVVLQQGYDKSYDHWSWGVMLYQMIVGVTPFYDGKIDQMTLYKRICKGKYEFPGGGFMSSSSKDLIRRILVPNPKERLGSFAAGDIDIRRHSWFDGIDWKKLAKKEIKAPWVPKIADPLDGNNFANWDHLEKEDSKKLKPLSAKEQNIFKDF